MESDTRDGHIDADADADAEARGRVLGLDTIQYDTILFDPNRLLRTHEIYIPNRFLLDPSTKRHGSGQQLVRYAFRCRKGGGRGRGDEASKGTQ
jgi:GNAT superfamily N-acetyltransferase